MQMVQKGQQQGQSSMLYLPMIDVNPSDLRLSKGVTLKQLINSNDFNLHAEVFSNRF